MKRTSLRANPPAPSATRIQSSMGRPMTVASALGTSSVSGPRRLPRPAPITMGRIDQDDYHKSSPRAGVEGPRDLRHPGWAMTTPDSFTIGVISDLHFGPQALYRGKLRKMTHLAGELT